MKFSACLPILLILCAMGCDKVTTPEGDQSQQPQNTTSDEGLSNSSPRPTSPLLEGGDVFDGKAFRVKLPKEWIVVPDKVVALHARELSDALYPNIKVAIVKPPSGITLEKVVKDSSDSYLKNGSVEETKKITFGEQDAFRLIMTQELLGNQNRQLKYFIPANPYVLIFSGQAETESFDSHLPLFEAVVESLEVVPL